MARKSRKNKNVDTLAVKTESQVEKNQDLLETAAYIRLSVENGGNETDDTLRTQELLVEKYISNHPDLRLADMYVDNGWSGTNFERPEFQRLMEDVRSGRIQCIVVKDLSRFGRDYLETGYYLETIFPKLNVRFIAITDDFDSTRKEDVESLAVPIKNMVNALYAKDMSKKILAAKEAQRKRGTVKIARAPYGYHVSEDGMSLETDLETAPYVRMIFQWYLLGVGLYEIARRLNLLGIATPGQRAEQDVLTVPLEETKWAPSAVQKILNNPSYTGDLVMGRYKQSLYKGEKRRYTEPEEWFVQKDTHEAMVARDDYAELEKRGKEVSREWKEQRERYDADREKYQDSFAGMVRCADCGGSMHYVRYTHDYTDNEKMGAYYVCRSSKRTALCSDHKIEENLLKIVVMDQIQVLIQAMCSQKQLLRRIQDGAGGSNPMQDAVMKICILERNIAQTEERSAKLYEHYAEGILDAEDFQTMKERYAQEVQTMKGELQEVQESKRRLDRKIQRYTDMASRVEIYLGDRSFHEELVKELVDYVEVSASGAIHVCFRCADEFQAVAALTGSVADGKG